MTLKDTVEMMNSNDYKERFKAEYYQLEILDKWDNGELDFTPTCPRNTYNNQFEYMVNYMTVLADRAAMEGIEL